MTPSAHPRPSMPKSRTANATSRRPLGSPRPPYELTPRTPGRSAGSRTRSRSRRRAGSKSWPMIPSPTSSTVRSTRSASSGSPPAGDLLVVEHVPVAAGGGLDVPGLAGGERGRARAGRRRRARRPCFGVAGLVVDQLVAAVGKAVDAVDAAAQVVRADLEVNLRSSQTGLASRRRCAARGSGRAPRRRGRGTAARRRSRRSRPPPARLEQRRAAGRGRPSVAARRSASR